MLTNNDVDNTKVRWAEPNPCGHWWFKKNKQGHHVASMTFFKRTTQFRKRRRMAKNKNNQFPSRKRTYQHWKGNVSHRPLRRWTADNFIFSVVICSSSNLDMKVTTSGSSDPALNFRNRTLTNRRIKFQGCSASVHFFTLVSSEASEMRGTTANGCLCSPKWTDILQTLDSMARKVTIF